MAVFTAESKFNSNEKGIYRIARSYTTFMQLLQINCELEKKARD
jgi:hypothetical protein